MVRAGRYKRLYDKIEGVYTLDDGIVKEVHERRADKERFTKERFGYQPLVTEEKTLYWVLEYYPETLI